MAFDPLARRAAYNYEGGRVVGARGLIEYFFGPNAAQANFVVTTDTRGRRRLNGLSNRTGAIGGKQIIISTVAGDTYQLHYSGALVDFATHCVPAMLGGLVNWWSTARGKKRYV